MVFSTLGREYFCKLRYCVHKDKDSFYIVW